jgi:hypothetical protein
MLDSEDTTKEERDNRLSDSTEPQRPLSLNTTLATQLTLQAMVVHPTLELPLPTQDGGNCSD